MSQPIRSSVRTFSRTQRTGSPVVAEAIEGRQLFAAHPHGFGPPPGHWDGARVEMTMVMPLTAVALYRAALAEVAAAEASASALTTASTSTQSVSPRAAVRAAQAERQPVDRAVPVMANAAKPADVAVRQADIEEAMQTTAAPTDAADVAAAEPAALTFGPFNVTAVMAASTAIEPKLSWVASAESSVLKPDVTPPVAARRVTAGVKAVETMPTETIVTDAVETQQAALGLPADTVAERPLWQRVSAILAGATLVAVNYVVRRRRRQLAATATR